MTPNPFSGLVHSRKFWLLVLDTVISLTSTVGAWYLAPQTLNQVIALLAVLQPLYIFVITSITKEDVAKTAMQAGMETARIAARSQEVIATKATEK